VLFGFGKKLELPSPDEALPGRSEPMPVPDQHYVNGNPLQPPFPEGMETALFGMGCFWGSERKFWETEGVYTTAVGYAAGHTPNPTYREVCSGMTGHNEVVFVVYDPSVISYEGILKVFWENHNPTQGMRQGNDTGTQYRSGIYAYSEASANWLKLRATLINSGSSKRATAKSLPKFLMRRSSTTPKITTSNTWRKIQGAIAVSAALGSLVRLA